MTSTIELIQKQHVFTPNPDLKALHSEATLINQRQQTLLPAEKSLSAWMSTRITEIKHEVEQ